MHYFSKKKTQDIGLKNYFICIYEKMDVHYLYHFLMYISQDIMLYISQKQEENQLSGALHN